MTYSTTKFSLQEFLDLLAFDRYELIDGEIRRKMSPKYRHSRLQGRLFRLLDDWCTVQQCGRVCPEWAVILQRRKQDWVLVPDLTYVSYEKLSVEWEEDEPCAVQPELVIEIISPGQSFGEMTSKATDYLLAGVNRVWVVDNQAESVTVFGNSEFPQTFWVNDTISDPLLPELAITLSDLFTLRKPPNANQNQ